MEGENPLVVGVLGGMGSYTTLHFFERLLDAFPVEKEWERPRIVIDNHCVLPSRVRAILYDEGRDALVAGMAESLRLLAGCRPDVIVIPCHTAHCFLDEVRARLDGEDEPLLDMVALVADHCRDAGVEEVFLIATEGTIDTRLYDRYCEGRGVRVRYPDEGQQVRLRDFIEQVKQRRALDTAGFVDFVDGLGDVPVILGCTELSVLQDAVIAQGRTGRARVIDPLALVVDRIAAMSAQSMGTGQG